MDKFVKLWKDSAASHVVDLSPKKQRQAKLFELKKVCLLGVCDRLFCVILITSLAPSIRACPCCCTFDLRYHKLGSSQNRRSWFSRCKHCMYLWVQAKRSSMHHCRSAMYTCTGLHRCIALKQALYARALPTCWR